MRTPHTPLDAHTNLYKYFHFFHVPHWNGNIYIGIVYKPTYGHEYIFWMRGTLDTAVNRERERVGEREARKRNYKTEYCNTYTTYTPSTYRYTRTQLMYVLILYIGVLLRVGCTHTHTFSYWVHTEAGILYTFKIREHCCNMKIPKHFTEKSTWTLKQLCEH